MIRLLHLGPPNHANIQPYSGQYTTSFIDPESGVRHNASLCLFFAPDAQRQGYRISGQGSDIDGNTIVEDGFVNYDGTCWWIERTISGDVGLQVLSRGRFNFHQGTFDGNWLANTMLSGQYLSFKALNSPDQQQKQNNITTSNIPVVTGVVVQGNSQPSNSTPVTVVGTTL